MAAPPLSLARRVAGASSPAAAAHSSSRSRSFRPRLLPSKRWSGVVKMGAAVGGGQGGEEEETRQAKEMAAARKRWETLIREQKIKTLTPREAGLSKKAFNFMIGGWWSGSSTMSFNKNFVQQVEEKFSKDTDIILVCQKGLRSIAAAEQLYNAGFENLFWVQGGLEAAEEEDFEREGSQPFKLAGIGGVSEFFGWTDQQRAQAAKEGWGYRLLFTGRLVGAIVLADALFVGAQSIGPLLQQLQPH
ncbi:unnamed protein product [Triticum turgidum subsp. durum]|uniref:Rhodanese domain-containing protein n=1 Tax=Triticum turgidum subsp. durum TaxID=4567 RepID=A0A9R0YNQ2_TRITD|nr:unnamed protein product [Triticum turgidum subsp. durum]